MGRVSRFSAPYPPQNGGRYHGLPSPKWGADSILFHVTVKRYRPGVNCIISGSGMRSMNPLSHSSLICRSKLELAIPYFFAALCVKVVSGLPPLSIAKARYNHLAPDVSDCTVSDNIKELPTCKNLPSRQSDLPDIQYGKDTFFAALCLPTFSPPHASALPFSKSHRRS